MYFILLYILQSIPKSNISPKIILNGSFKILRICVRLSYFDTYIVVFFLFYVYKKKTNCSVSLKLQCNILYIAKQLYVYNCSYMTLSKNNSGKSGLLKCLMEISNLMDVLSSFSKNTLDRPNKIDDDDSVTETKRLEVKFTPHVYR